MKNLARALLFSCLLFNLFDFSSPALAKSTAPEKGVEEAAAVPPREVADWPAAALTVGWQYQENESEGLGDLLIPVFPFSSSLLFVNPRASRTDHSAEEYNLGLGWRYLFPRSNMILGANAYYDYRDTGNSTYHQWGCGLEFLSPWVDARANYYKPEGTRNTVNSATEQQVERSSSSNLQWEDPYATGHAIQQTAVLEQSSRTTTTTMFFEQYERAMEGCDGEVGLRLPLPLKPAQVDARLFGGYYWFDAGFGEDVAGFKARAELRLLSSLYLDAGWFENKDLTGSDYYVGGRWRVPFDVSALAKGRNPFAEMTGRLRSETLPFSSRLTEMVVRDPHVRTEMSGFIEREDLRQVEVRRSSSTQRKDFTLLDDVTFVGQGGAGGNGMAEHTYGTVQEGVDNAFGRRNVYVFGGGAYDENVVLTPGITLWGGGCAVPGNGGKSFGGGSYPTIDGRSQGPAITLADNATVKGFRVTNSDQGGGPVFEFLPFLGDTDVSRTGILGNDVTGVKVGCNLIEGAMDGVLMGRGGDFSLMFQNNVVRNNEGAGLLLGAMGGLVGEEPPPFEEPNRASRFPSPEGTLFELLVDNSQFVNNSAGLDVTALGYDFTSLGIQNSQALNNREQGMLLRLLGSEEASVQVLDSAVTGNGDAGLDLLAVGSSFFEAHFSGLTASDNDGTGVQVHGSDVELGLLSLDRSSASDNAGTGFDFLLSGDVVLANVSGFSAHRNGGPGFMLDLQGDEVAVGLVGMPDALSSAVLGSELALDLLPPEYSRWLGASGPVQVSGNQGGGILAIVESEQVAALAVLDVNATENFGAGIQGQVMGDSLAIGLAGSSKNLMETLQLGAEIASLFGLELPEIPASEGRMVLRDNVGPGLTLSVNGDSAALGGLLGVEAGGNLGLGAGLSVTSEEIAVALAARVAAHENMGMGLMVSADGGSSAFGVVLDAHANDNMAGGMVVAANSEDGMAGALVASTDPLRALAEILGEEFLGFPVVIPGEPFGPVLANGNGGDGIVLDVQGDDSAFAVLLDTHASGNVGNGLNVAVQSEHGTAISAFLSSDLLMEILPLEAPEGVASLGGIVVNENGDHGLRLVQSGQEGAYAIVAGLEAYGNGKDGVHAEVASTAGEAYAVMAFAEAWDNGGQGFSVELNAQEDALSVFAHVSAAGNDKQGIRVTATSATENAYALLGGVYAASNGTAGIALDLGAGGEASACLTDVSSLQNMGRGANISLLGAEGASLWMGPMAWMDFEDYFNPDLGFMEWAAFEFPEGPVNLSENGAAGLLANVHATDGDVQVAVLNVTANDNANDGMNINMGTAAGLTDAYFSEVMARGNTGRGVDLLLEGSAAGMEVGLEQVTARENENDGLRIRADGTGDVNVFGERIIAVDNTGAGVRINASAQETLVMDFGGGVLGSLGHSSLFGNGNRDFRNAGAGTVMAEDNWWGSVEPSASQFAGAVDYVPWLMSDPNP